MGCSGTQFEDESEKSRELNERALARLELGPEKIERAAERGAIGHTHHSANRRTL
jgi:hypothetical protein